MEIISINDIIFATASIRGKVTNLKLSGFMTMADVILAVKKEIGNVSGLLKISLRNMTQGWCREKSVYLSPVPVRRAGIQLTLF